jgi:hypothetical protein
MLRSSLREPISTTCGSGFKVIENALRRSPRRAIATMEAICFGDSWELDLLVHIPGRAARFGQLEDEHRKIPEGTYSERQQSQYRRK